MQDDKKIFEEDQLKKQDVEQEEPLEPNLGAAYRQFKRESVIPGTPAFLTYQLMSEFDEEKKKEAEDLVSKTLLPADLVTYVLDRAKQDPKAAKVFREELKKRLAKTSRSE